MEESGFMETAGFFLSLLGEGQSLSDIFHGGPDFHDMLVQLETDLMNIFNQILANDAVRQATSAAQSSSDWLRIEYIDAINAGETKEELWSLLTDSSDNPGLNGLKQQAFDMESWASENPTDIAQQTAPLALMIHGLIVAIFRERARQAPDPATAAAETSNQIRYAQEGFSRVAPLFARFRQGRFGGISAPSEFIVGSGFVEWNVEDPWPGAPVLTAFGRWNATPSIKSQCQQAWRAYLRVLQTGSDSAAADFTNAVSQGAFSGDGGAPDGGALIANYLPALQATGKWMASAPAGLRGLWAVAGGPPEYEVAYQGQTNRSLCTFGNGGPNDWLEGFADGTVPSIIATPDGGYFISFQDSNGRLRHAGSGGSHDDVMALAPGTSPSVARLDDGSFRSWYQEQGTNILAAATAGPDWNVQEYELGMMPGTSPSVALVGGDVSYAFQANTGALWVNGAGTPCLMAAGSSPSIAAFPNGTWLVAFADRDGTLTTWDGTDANPFQAQVAPGTNPVLAAAGDASFQIAFHAADGTLQLAGPDGVAATGKAMMAGTGPGIAALYVGGYQRTFQAADGSLVAAGDAGSATATLPIYNEASPAIAGISLAPQP
ncbi:MAG: hypothetical protein JO013_00420 [Alphaproteobacteria bacterium]|nr:hypothetical protein [Alphaproteobacteria bacterium]